MSFLLFFINKKENLEYLDFISSSYTKHLKTYFEQNLERIKVVTNKIGLIRTVEEYELNKNEFLLSEIIFNIKNTRDAIEEFRVISLVDNKGEIIASTDNNLIENNVKNKKYYLEGKQKEGIYFIKKNGEYIAVGSGPFILDGRLLGVILIEANLNKVEEIVKPRNDLGQTGEVLLGLYDDDGNIDFLFERRFEEDAIIFLKKDDDKIAYPMRGALKGQEKKMDNILDYRGEKVTAFTSYLDELGLGVVVKVDRSDFLSSVYKLLSVFAVLLFLFVVSFYFFANKISLFISKPIEKLKKEVGEIDKENLDYKVDIKGNDEVSDLSRFFSEMIAEIKKSRKEVDEKVKKQTEKIILDEKDMRDQQKAILNILEDVEEEKEKALQERDKTNKIIQSIGDAVFVIDENLKIVLCNDVTVKISGYNKKELIGKKYYEKLKFIFEDSRKINDKFVKNAFKTGEIQEMSNHTVLIRGDKKEVPVADSSAPLKDKQGKVVGCIVVFRDVTKEREIDRAKTEFVSLASHQLRTPLSIINWYTEMLLSGDSGKLNKKQKKYLGKVAEGNGRMVELVDSLLNVSRLDTGTFVIEPKLFDITKISDESIEEIKPLIREKKIKFTKKYDKNIKKIKLDKKLTSIIFNNLLSNAIKYTPEKGRVNLQILKNSKTIKIIITDTGIGIPVLNREKIFTKLFRADNVVKADTQGTGLGLYMIKTILDHSGGKVWFKSKINKGSKFSVEIPLSGMTEKKGTKKLD